MEYTLQNGHEVEVGSQYRMDFNNQQLGVPEGEVLTVVDILKAPDGIHIKFAEDLDNSLKSRKEDLPLEIYAFAMENMLEEGDLSYVGGSGSLSEQSLF